MNREVSLYNEQLSDGRRHVNNFRNRYLKEEDLMKPSKEIGEALSKYSSEQLYNLEKGRNENMERSLMGGVRQ